jgi:hypothetical protein
VWWYTALARRYGVRRAWVVSESDKGGLVAAVRDALRAGGAEEVTLVSNSPEADLGTLMRARNIVMSNSTFAWWGCALAPFLPAAYLRTVESLRGAPAAGGSGGEAAAAAAAPPPPPPAPDAPVTVLQPLTGMLRPGSVHTLHADIALASMPPQRWCDATRGAAGAGDALSAPLRVVACTVWAPEDAAEMEGYCCSTAQARRVVEAQPPAWAEEGVVWAEAKEEAWDGPL